MLAGARGIEDIQALPPLAELLAAWDAVDGTLAVGLTTLSSAALDALAPHRYPGGDPSVLGTIAFLVQHDRYHVGQLALLRRAL